MEERQQVADTLLHRVLRIGVFVFIAYHFLYISDIFTFLNIPIDPLLHTPMHLGIFLFLLFLLTPAKKGAQRGIPPWYDIILAILSLIPTIYFATYVAPNWHDLVSTTNIEYAILGWLLVLLILEAVRRVLGLIFLSVILIFIIHALTASHWPGIMRGLEQPFQDLGAWAYVQTSGIFGVPVRISSIIIIAFLFFGSVLLASGAAKTFIDLCHGLMGRFRGGPAKIAVVGSAFLGMVTGSSVSNVMTTGVLTIPLMKKTGFSKNFAGAIEAVASNGGMLMPPIMGATIFVLCAFTGIPYVKVMIACFIPAILYYWALFLAMDFESVRLGIKGLPKSQLPSLRSTIKEGWHFAIPIIVLLVLLIPLKWSPQKSVLWATLILLVMAASRKNNRLGLKGLLDASWDTMKGMFMVIGGVAAAGILLTCLGSTGLGTSLAVSIIEITGGHLIFLLLLAAIVSYIMGMGMSIIAIYIILAVLVAPALVQAGIPNLAAHLFVIWWAGTYFITPPIAPAVIAACAISGGDYLKSGLLAMRLAGPVYILPFCFCLGPALLLMGSPSEIIYAVISAAIGISALTCGLWGWMLVKTGWVSRIFLAAGGIATVWPEMMTDIIGYSLIAVGALLNFIAYRVSRARKIHSEM